MGCGGDSVELQRACCSGIQSMGSKRFECSEIAPNFTGSCVDRNSAVDGGLESLNGDAGCVSSGSGAEDGTRLVSECEDVHGLVVSKVLEKEPRGVSDCYLDGRESGFDDTTMKRIVPGGGSDGFVNVLNSETCMDFMESSSPRHYDKQNEYVDESDGGGGVVVENYVTGLAEKMTETHDQAVVSLGCKMHEEFIGLSGSPRKTVEEDKQVSEITSERFAAVMADKIADLSGMENENVPRDMKEGIDGLAAVEIGTHHKINSSPICEIPVGLTQQCCLPEFAIKDRHYAVSGTSPERAAEITEQKSVNLEETDNYSIQVVPIDLCGSLAGIHTGVHEDIVSLQVLESTEEFVAAPRSDFEKDNQVSGTSADIILTVKTDDGVEFSRLENDSAVDVVEETNGSLAAIETETHQRTPHAHCIEIRPEFVTVKCLPSNNAELEKESGIDYSPSSMEDKSVPLIGIDTKSPNQVLPSGEHGTSSEAVPMKSPLSNFHKLEHLKDDQTTCCHESRTDKKSNSLVVVAAISNEFLSPTGVDKSLELISLAISKEAVKGDERRQDESFYPSSVEQDMELKKDESYILPGSVPVADNQISSSLDLEISAVDFSSDDAKKNKHRDDESCNGQLNENMILEGKGITTDITVNTYRLSLQMEEKAFEFKEGLVASQCLEKPVSKQSCQHVITSQDSFSEKLVLTCIPGVDVCCNVDSGCGVDCFGDTDAEGKNHAASANCASEAKYLHIASRPSERICGVRKSSRQTQTKRTARNCRNRAKVPDLDGSAQTILKIARKRRSCFSKPARFSEWGSMGNITQTFSLSNVITCDDTESHELQKSKVGQGTRQAIRNCNSSSQGRKLTAKQRASTSCICLKVGTDISQHSSSLIIPRVVDTSSSIDIAILGDGCESCGGAIAEIPNFTTDVQDDFGDERSKHLLQCFNNLPNKENSQSSNVDVLLTNKDVEGAMFCPMSGGDAAENGISMCIEAQLSGVETEKRYTDPGTSPDSEVINLVPDGQLTVTCKENSSDANLTFSKACAAPRGGASSKKSKKKDRHPNARNLQDESTCLASLKKVKPTKKSGRRQRKCDGLSAGEVPTTSISATSSNSIRSQEYVLKQSILLKETELGISREDSEVKILKAEISFGPDIGLKMSESQMPNNLHLSTKSRRTCLPKKSGGLRKGRSKASARSRKASGCKESRNELKSLSKNKVKEKEHGACDPPCKDEDDPKIGNHIEDGTGKSNISDNIASVDSANLELSSTDILEQYLPSDDAWVRCDDCFKWRRIPVSIVDSISETNCQWICKDNMDKAFADCSIPQEKSNAEINAELGISDTDANAYDFASDDKGLECMRTPASKENEFTLITSNQFSHRSRKTQTIDEIMVCHCKAPRDGSFGCGDECLNRMLNIECVQGTCPCGNLCSNQQFQKRTYVSMRWDRCGKKGFGLRLEKDISKGQFLIEYVGEVLDVHSYAVRIKEYAARGHKHFYFMTLDGSEIIDACSKGNLGRFINHSCDPNCRTEKWVVNGEICIGLFALRDINQGEEVTFDYNYVRVVGAAAKRCYCGSPQCRGYIGGDPTKTEVIDQVDSDEEFPEPVILENEEVGDTLRSSIAKDTDKMASFRKVIGKSVGTTNIEDFSKQSASAISQLNGSFELGAVKEYSSTAGFPKDMSPQNELVTSKCTSAGQNRIVVEDVATKVLHSVERLEKSSSSMFDKSSFENIVTNRKSKNVIAEAKRVFVKSRFYIKTSRQSGAVKTGNFPSSSIHANNIPMMSNNMQILSIKPKKLMEGTSNGHFEAVQEKLNELLNAEGGINKRKDAPGGYLKLLLLTAASGAHGNGESIQSNRELSMILDALLKTKSRVVLMDIINKNGLRMLHNIMKQYRRDFKKIPILRKLLKVLEYLAIREILTLEHISCGPPFPGMESFAESMLSLTEHDDKQVHQIARNFRDRWIPKHIRKRSFMDRDDGRMEFLGGSSCMWMPADHRHLNDQEVRNGIDCMTKPANASGDTSVNESSSTSGTKVHKRKSRWDQPSKVSTGSRSLELDNRDKATRECSYCPHCARNYGLQDRSGSSNTERQNIDEDAPPGFSSPVNPSVVSFNSSQTVDNYPQQIVKPASEVVGLPQSKFISRLPVSYGIPLGILHQFGSPYSESLENWRITPGMAFHPFPPLPSVPSVKRESPSYTVNPLSIDETAEQGRWGSHDSATCPKEVYSSMTSASQSQPVMDTTVSSHHQGLKRTRPSSFDIGRRYFRQQKWNKMAPPWVRNRNGWGLYIGDNCRGGICSTEVGSVKNHHKNSCCSSDVNL